MTARGSGHGGPLLLSLCFTDFGSPRDWRMASSKLVVAGVASASVAPSPAASLSSATFGLAEDGPPVEVMPRGRSDIVASMANSQPKNPSRRVSPSALIPGTYPHQEGSANGGSIGRGGWDDGRLAGSVVKTSTARSRLGGGRRVDSGAVRGITSGGGVEQRRTGRTVR